MHRAVLILFLLALVSAIPARAQEPEPPSPPVPVSEQQPAAPPQPQTEHEALEEEHIRSRIENGESHASGARPDLGALVLGNPTTAAVALRVGLHTTAFTPTGAVAPNGEFSSLHHTFVELSNTVGDVKVIDRATGKEIVVMTAGSRVFIERSLNDLLVSLDGVYIGAFSGSIFFRPASAENFFRVEHIRRIFSGTKVPLYRGAMEVGRSAATLAGRINLFNIVEIEDYVPGVVANESIASFHVEALKAQAVAARGYAIANIDNYVRRGFLFDIVDSSLSQVYRGVISEHANAVRASAETYGLVASSNGQIISAMYSSSFGGHSEDSEWISFVLKRTTGNVTSYLRGIYDGVEPAPDLTTEAGIDAFWRFNPPASLIHDECTWTGNGFSRWKFTLSAATIKSRMTESNSTRIGPTGSRSGNITDVVITQRGAASKRAVVARVTFTTGVYEIQGWEGLRSVLGRTSATAPRACGTNTIAASFTLNNPSLLDVAKNADGTVSTVTVYGGGWGHNMGMSQYGAHGRGKLGQVFIQILKAYYTGVEIGSYPIDIGREPGTGPPTLRQRFYAPNANGTLEIRPADLKGLRVHINEVFDLSFDEAALASELIQVDISPYLMTGLNVIHYSPVGRTGSATVNVVVR